MLYAARAMRGFFALNLPIAPQVRRDFRLDLIGAIMFGVFNGSVISYLYVVARTIGVSPLGISVLVAMPAIGAILALPISLSIQGEGARRFMFLSWTLGRALMLVPLLSQAVPLYFVVSAGFLISSSVATPFYAAIMQHIYPREFRGRLMSLVRVGSGAATTLASLLTAWLLGSVHLAFSIVFGAGAALAILSLLAFSRITRFVPPPRARQSLRETFAILGRDRPFTTYQIGVMVMGLGNIMAATLYPLVIVDKLHAGYGSFGILTICSSLGYLTSFFVWGRIVDRTGPLFTIFLVGACTITQPLGMLLAPGVYWLMPVALFGGFIMAGFELGIYSAAIHYAGATPHEVPRYMALHSNFSGMRGLAGPFLATAILGTRHYGLALGCALLLTAGGTALLWSRHRAQQPALQPATAH